jgi:hypothetical protein
MKSINATVWSKRIRALQKAGLTLETIGLEVGLSKSAMGDLATGRKLQPMGDAAVRLYALHMERCSRVNGKRRG